VKGAPPDLNTISSTNKLLGLSYVNAINEWTYLITFDEYEKNLALSEQPSNVQYKILLLLSVG
jgi:hypothetical protein